MGDGSYDFWRENLAIPAGNKPCITVLVGMELIDESVTNVPFGIDWALAPIENDDDNNGFQVHS